MSESLISPPAKKNFDFIDSIRCIAMIGIVMEHSVYVGTYVFKGLNTNHLVYMGLIQLSKFGTIAFFLLAGFLIGDKFKDYSPLVYFKRRLSNTFKPWLLWSLVFLFAILFKEWVVMHRDATFDYLGSLEQTLKIVYLFSNYWFIINFLICIAILLIFRKYLYSNFLGLVLLVASLTYSVNIYFEWFEPLHTTAIFGFVFYLWLGAKLHQKWDVVEKTIQKIPLFIFLIAFGATFVLSLNETAYLWSIKSTDPYNTLRLSNILYSMASIALLLKIRNFAFVKYIKPRETTFGIYLIHYIFVYSILPELFRPLHLPEVTQMSIGMMLLYVAIRFILTYGITWALVNMLSRSKIKWVVGR